MIYLLAIILPPVAVLLKGKPFQAILNLILTLFLWIPGIIHAILVINKSESDKRHSEMVQAIKDSQK
jgi:uncharacterized membrane protein YqaE (UPF0057 family)